MHKTLAWLLLLILAILIFYSCGQVSTLNPAPPPILTPSPTPTSESTTGNINGQINDTSTGLVLSGVTVTIKNSTSATTTDASGKYVFSDISTGVKTIEASKTGYVTNSITIEVRAGQTITAETISLSQEATLPDISTFLTNPSDRFLVDFETGGTTVEDGGWPFLGLNAEHAHAGAHIEFNNSTNKWPKGGTSPSNYPAIYAVADGTVSRIDHYFQVGANYRYGMDLTFAQNTNGNICFAYSIEPMINPNDSNFYEPYILVSEGQSVHKGDIIAYMYLAPSAGQGPHIHFHLQYPNNGSLPFMSPSIFNSSVVNRFFNHWGYGGTDGGTPIAQPCMGYKISAPQNPFGTGAKEYL